MVDITPNSYIPPSSAEVPGGIIDVSSDITIPTPSGTMVQPKKDTSVGGMQAGATELTQGQGNDIFKISPLGIHLGAANFADAPFSVNMAGNMVANNVDFTGGTIGGFTITATSLYGGIIKTAATVGSGTTGVIMDTDGLRGYDSVLGNTFNLPTDGSAPTFSSGVINEVTFEISTNAVLRTSATVGDGTANSAGILINNTGIYACEANQLTSAANIRMLIDGSGFFSGTFNLGGTQITVGTMAEVYTALTTVSSAGGGIVYLDNGTYTLTADITIPTGVTLQGVSRDGVILDCDGTYKVEITGTNPYTTGTIAINDASTTVTGSGTTFTSAMVGRYIYLDGLWFEITVFTNTTTITIGTAYTGSNLTGYAYAIADVNFNPIIRKLTIQNATGAGFVVSYVNEPWIDDLVVTSCGTGMDLDYVVFPKIFVLAESNGVNINMNYVSGFKVDYCSFSFASTGNGVTMTNCISSTFFDSAVDECTGDGVNMTDCRSVAFISNTFNSNGGQGLEMVSGCNDNPISSCIANGNTSDGIKLTATSDRNTIVATTISNNGGYGINIAASTCDDNVIVSPTYSNNTSGNLNDSGTGTVILPETFIKIKVSQSSHGLSVGNIIKVSGAGTYATAQANSAANAEAVGIVTAVIDSNNFVYATEGVITKGVPAVAAGTVLFLSSSSAGSLTSTEPTTAGTISKPLAVVIVNATSMQFINYRGIIN